MTQSLYRTYRPQTFDDVVGQEHVERTLRHAVAEGNIAHAYLFTGPRGTGKTTTARLLAKALLCKDGPTANPCGVCEDCLEIAESTHPDVYELDAASRTGVDNVREEIIGRVAFAATRGYYKVYIIDEVHMLTNQAFNALLKTLEEPPDHVIFVMCTTEPRKVPETVRSRCQRFEFHRISQEEIVARLQFICEKEGFEAEPEALEFIARHSTGGLRDAITSLEALAAFGQKQVRFEDAEVLLGKVESSILFEMAGHLAARDICACFKGIAALVESGTDLSLFARDFTQHLRNLYVTELTSGGDGIVEGTEEDLNQYRSQAATFPGKDTLARLLMLFESVTQQLRNATDKRLAIETAFVRASRAEEDLTLEALAERMERIECRAELRAAAAPVPAAVSASVAASAPVEAAAHASTPAPVEAAAPATTTASASAPAPAQEPAKPKATPAPAPAPTATPAPAVIENLAEPTAPATTDSQATGTSFNNNLAVKTWASIVAHLKPSRRAFFQNAVASANADGTGLLIEFPESEKIQLKMANDERGNIATYLKDTFGTTIPFEFRGSIKVSNKSAAPVPASAAENVVSALAEAMAPASSAPSEASFVPAAPEPETVPLDTYDSSAPYEDPYEDDPSIPFIEPSVVQASAQTQEKANEPEPEPEPESKPAENPYSSLLTEAFGDGVTFTNE